MSAKPGTLWIGDLDPHMDELFLKHAFALMGENLLQAKIIKNKVNGTTVTEKLTLGEHMEIILLYGKQDTSLQSVANEFNESTLRDFLSIFQQMPVGYGFLEFGDEQIAQKVLHRCNGKVMPNAPPKRFKLNHASYGKEHLQQREHSLFVGDLTPEVDDLALYTAFSCKFPSVKTAKVVLDQNGLSKGFGFVRFTSEEEYQRALTGMQNSTIVGSKPIRVSVATPKRAYNHVPQNQEVSTVYHYPLYDYQNYYPTWQGYQHQYFSYGFDPLSCAIFDPNYQTQQIVTHPWMWTT